MHACSHSQLFRLAISTFQKGKAWAVLEELAVTSGRLASHRLAQHTSVFPFSFIGRECQLFLFIYFRGDLLPDTISPGLFPQMMIKGPTWLPEDNSAMQNLLSSKEKIFSNWVIDTIDSQDANRIPLHSLSSLFLQTYPLELIFPTPG